MKTKLEYFLECLTEENAEIIQRIQKAQRFGLDEIQEGQLLTNRERIMYEVADFLAVAELIKELDPKFDLSSDEVETYILNKKQKVEKYYQYSKSLGLVE